MKKDVAKLLKKFKTTGFKNGDLVLTAQIHRVKDKDWGRKHCSPGMEVVEEWPNHSNAPYIMVTGQGGQHAIMKLTKGKI